MNNTTQALAFAPFVPTSTESLYTSSTLTWLSSPKQFGANNIEMPDATNAASIATSNETWWKDFLEFYDSVTIRLWVLVFVYTWDMFINYRWAQRAQRIHRIGGAGRRPQWLDYFVGPFIAATTLASICLLTTMIRYGLYMDSLDYRS